MSLIEEAKKVAAEFEYPGAEVNKGVREFIRQMGEYWLGFWLQQHVLISIAVQMRVCKNLAHP